MIFMSNTHTNGVSLGKLAKLESSGNGKFVGLTKYYNWLQWESSQINVINHDNKLPKGVGGGGKGF
jgi:hypothetical protein